MTIRPIAPEESTAFNAVVSHPLQSYQWGEFREKSGVKVIRRGIFEKEKLVSGFQLTIHTVPHTNYTIGYLPKGALPTKAVIEELKKIGKEEKCIFIQLEPNVIDKRHSGGVQNQSKEQQNQITDSGQARMTELGLTPAAHPLFTKYTFVLDLTQSEEEILKNMHSKSRYNIKVAQKHTVQVKEDNSDKAFKAYWKLTEETTTRQKFYAHTKRYHELQWETFKHSSMKDELTSHLFTATYDGKILTTLLFFVFRDTLYYPYGASSNEHRNVMHSNLAMWEGIRFGKSLGLTKFDMWGAMGPDPDPKDPWFGFHNFKEKFSPDHVEFIGSYDLVLHPLLYQGYKVTDKLRWFLLKVKK
ncbi:MAG: peptidoglycan bridge formation glycyltransferase FemA/FemB family protein [Candidatus Levybacteria bacterium]|nr:peptidoglycan bridge formation glycyltransferase FemA/FemB family protein [Candidatus Levybacteria bacterium]